MPPVPRKPISNKESFLDLTFPAKGLDLSQAYSAQPKGTTPVAVNVRAYDPATGRERGGQRPGSVKYVAGQVNGTALIQDLNSVVSVGGTPPAAPVATQLVQLAPLATSGAASSGVATFSATVTAGNTVVVLITSVGSQAVSGVTDSAGNTYSMVITKTNGTQSSACWYSGAVTGAVTTVTVTFAGSTAFGINCAELLGPATAQLAASAGATGTSASADPTAATPAVGNCVAFGQVQSSLTGTITLPTGFTLIQQSATNAGMVCYAYTTSTVAVDPVFALSGSATWAALVVVFKGPTVATQTTQSDRNVTLVAVSQGTAKVVPSGGVSWQTVGNGASALATTGPIFSTSLNQQLYFADGVNAAYYDPAINTVVPLVASAGSLPGSVGARWRLIETWRGRLVVSGLLSDPMNWFMAAVSDATNWNNFPSAIVSTQAIAGNNSPMGLVGKPVMSLCPYSDDVLIMGTTDEVWLMQGDPMAGGSLSRLTPTIGFAWGRPWVIGPDGTLFFFSNKNGIYSLVPGGRPMRMSQQIDPLLVDVDTGANLVRMVWNDVQQGFHVFITPTASAQTATHYFWEQRTGAWLQDQFTPNSRNPIAVCQFDGNLPTDRRTLVGAWDGYVRALSPTATKDDGATINSSVLLGPFLTRDLDDVMTKDLQAVLGESSGDVTFDVFVGSTAEKALTSVPVVTGTWGPGRNYDTPIRRAGHAIYVRITATNYWALESIRARVEAKYRVRQRGA